VIAEFIGVFAIGEVAADASAAGAAEGAGVADQLPLFVNTPRGIATQELTPEALAARDQVLRGASLFKGGGARSVPASEAQFFALESPSSVGYAGRFGIPPGNLPFEWIAEGRLAPGADFVTRAARGVEWNPGGAIEVVTWPGSFIGGG
jgi:hypothetical protein